MKTELSKLYFEMNNNIEHLEDCIHTIDHQVGDISHRLALDLPYVELEKIQTFKNKSMIEKSLLEEKKAIYEEIAKKINEILTPQQ